jgi:transcriptional regulator with XRE-family HTH domain
MATVLPFRAMPQLPNRIRDLRKARGWRLEDLADKVGCGLTQISDLERGIRPLNWHWLQSVARALRVQPADLLNESDNSRSLDPGEREWLALYAEADEQQRSQLLQMGRILVGRPPRRRKAG